MLKSAWLILILAGSTAFSSLAQPHRETNGRLLIEAEAFDDQTHPDKWRKVRVGHGWAMKPLPGPWSRRLSYSVTFSTPGRYRAWVLARRNPVAPADQGKQIKLFLFPAGQQPRDLTPSAAQVELDLKDQRLFRWVDWAANGAADVTVPAPGQYILSIAGGADDQCGWELDKLYFTLGNQKPPDHFDASR